MPIAQILQCAEEADCDTIITCGHSLGGAVSSISAIDLLQFIGPASSTTVHNITFGEPFFANERVRETCKQDKLDQHLLHYVSHRDIVPGLLSLRHTANMIKDKISGTL